MQKKRTAGTSKLIVTVCAFESQPCISPLLSALRVLTRNKLPARAWQKEKRPLLGAEGEDVEDLAKKHGLTLHRDGRVYAWHGIRWLDPENSNDKDRIIKNMIASPLAWWMVSDKTLGQLMSSLRKWNESTARTETYKMSQAKKIAASKELRAAKAADMVEKQVLPLLCKRLRLMACF